VNVRDIPSTLDDRLSETFGAPIADLYDPAAEPDAPPALTRALELRAFLAMAEQQVRQVRDRVHQAMAPEQDLGTLSAENLRFDAQWLHAALEARNGYRTALGDLLDTTTRSPEHERRSVRLTQHTLSTTPPTAAPARPNDGDLRGRHR
jgi:hypothetical protein